MLQFNSLGGVMATQVPMYRSSRKTPVERRREFRHRVTVGGLAAVDGDAGKVSGELLDLSIYGCRLRCAASVAGGEALQITVVGWPVVQAEVIWVEAGLIACRFTHPISTAMLRSLTLRAA